MTTREALRATAEGEARILCLIDGFSRGPKKERALEGRTKLAKLDFLLRYPQYLERALEAISASESLGADSDEDRVPLTERMVRYRYGPWDPQYFSILGRLIGKRLIEPIPGQGGYAYRTTAYGRQVVERLADDESYDALISRIEIIRKNFDWKGNRLKDFLYETFPEIADSKWGRSI
ncbi:hypothetical protein [Micromonospora sp. NBRC 110038]|uniref:hypothetical protein n=1 Tax=Micromonospora sp. NBRC 110038 TaxID=1550034 RepID=UPI001E5E9C1F|nr:hypothetical protein [Micromonospora sp. NBRC 110038]